ncbi:MAG: ATP-binding protein, partial [Magnetococcus sp. YQC-3]
ASAARDSAQALLTIINDILDFSRIEAGKLEIKSEEFRPLKIVEEVVGLVTPQAQGKNISLLVDVSNRVPAVLLGDPARIRQVLINLVGNAVKFTKKGEVAIRVRLEKKSKSQLTVCFAVADTGIGIPKANQHRLFQPFTQVDGSSTRPYGGTGLGLSIASRLVELMGGQIGYENRKER